MRRRRISALICVVVLCGFAAALCLFANALLLRRTTTAAAEENAQQPLLPVEEGLFPDFNASTISALPTPPCVARHGLALLSARLIRAWRMVGFVLLHHTQKTYGEWETSCGRVLSARELASLDFACVFVGAEDRLTTPLNFGSKEFSTPGWAEVAAWALCDVPDGVMARLSRTSGATLHVVVTLDDVPIAQAILDATPPPRPARISLSAVMTSFPWDLPQWVRYHKRIGVDHARIYLATNVVKEGAVRRVFDEAGMDVDIIPWAFPARYYIAWLQNNAILDTSFWAVDSCEWFIVHDFDEYVQVLSPTSGGSLATFLGGLSRWAIGSLRLYHYIGGPCPKAELPPNATNSDSLSVKFPMRSEDHYNLDRTKSIYRSKWTFLAMQHRIEFGLAEIFANHTTELRLIHYFCSLKNRRPPRKEQWVPNDIEVF